VTVKIVIKYVTPSNLVRVCQHFKGTNCLRHQMRRFFYLYFKTLHSFIQIYDRWIVNLQKKTLISVNNLNISQIYNTTRMFVWAKQIIQLLYIVKVYIFLQVEIKMFCRSQRVMIFLRSTRFCTKCIPLQANFLRFSASINNVVRTAEIIDNGSIIIIMNTNWKICRRKT
jgi:hypothetical protein